MTYHERRLLDVEHQLSRRGYDQYLHPGDQRTTRVSAMDLLPSMQDEVQVYESYRKRNRLWKESHRLVSWRKERKEELRPYLEVRWAKAVQELRYLCVRQDWIQERQDSGRKIREAERARVEARKDEVEAFRYHQSIEEGLDIFSSWTEDDAFYHVTEGRQTVNDGLTPDDEAIGVGRCKDLHVKWTHYYRMSPDERKRWKEGISALRRKALEQGWNRKGAAMDEWSQRGVERKREAVTAVAESSSSEDEEIHREELADILESPTYAEKEGGRNREKVEGGKNREDATAWADLAAKVHDLESRLKGKDDKNRRKSKGRGDKKTRGELEVTDSSSSSESEAERQDRKRRYSKGKDSISQDYRIPEDSVATVVQYTADINSQKVLSIPECNQTDEAVEAFRKTYKDWALSHNKMDINRCLEGQWAKVRAWEEVLELAEGSFKRAETPKDHNDILDALTKKLRIKTPREMGYKARQMAEPLQLSQVPKKDLLAHLELVIYEITKMDHMRDVSKDLREKDWVIPLVIGLKRDEELREILGHTPFESFKSVIRELRARGKEINDLAKKAEELGWTIRKAKGTESDKTSTPSERKSSNEGGQMTRPASGGGHQHAQPRALPQGNKGYLGPYAQQTSYQTQGYAHTPNAGYKGENNWKAIGIPTPPLQQPRGASQYPPKLERSDRDATMGNGAQRVPPLEDIRSWQQKRTYVPSQDQGREASKMGPNKAPDFNYTDRGGRRDSRPTEERSSVHWGDKQKTAGGVKTEKESELQRGQRSDARRVNRVSIGKSQPAFGGGMPTFGSERPSFRDIVLGIPTASSEEFVTRVNKAPNKN